MVYHHTFIMFLDLNIKKNMSEADKNPYTASIKKNEEEEDDLHLTGCNALPCCDPRRAGHRFTVLIFLCFLSFGE